MTYFHGSHSSLNAVDAVGPTVAGNSRINFGYIVTEVCSCPLRLNHRLPKHRQAFGIVLDDGFNCPNIFAHVIIDREGHPLPILLVRLRAWMPLGDSGVVAKGRRSPEDGTELRLSDSGRAALLLSLRSQAVRSSARSATPCLLASLLARPDYIPTQTSRNASCVHPGAFMEVPQPPNKNCSIGYISRKTPVSLY